MTPKPKRNWIDVQMALMTISMASVLGLWNLFANLDRETALRKAAEEQASQPDPVESPPPPEPAIIVTATAIPLPEPGEKIMLGGSAPQTQIIIRQGGGGGGGGGGPVTSTSSS